MSNNPKRGNKPQKQNKENSQRSESEYDLSKNLNKVNSYSRGRRCRSKENTFRTESRNVEPEGLRDNLIREPFDTSHQTYSGAFSWDSYTRLDDKLSSFSESNSEAHTQLRQELENKISEKFKHCDDSIKTINSDLKRKLETNHFYWIIGGLLAILTLIATIWWNISYSSIIKLPSNVQNIDNSVKQCQEKNKELEEKINQIEKQEIHRNKSQNRR